MGRGGGRLSDAEEEALVCEGADVISSDGDLLEIEGLVGEL